MAPQPVAQGLQPGTAMWSTISPAALQTGGPSLTPGVLASADAARAAMFLSQLAALQPLAQGAAQLPTITSHAAYVAPLADGSTQKQPRSNAQSHAALNRNDVWIPYSVANLGSYLPYPHIRPPEICFECNVPSSHAGNECPLRFLRIFGAPLPGWTRDGKKDTAAWSGDGTAMLQPTREALAKYLKDHGVPPHRNWPVSTAEIASPQPPERRGRAP